MPSYPQSQALYYNGCWITYCFSIMKCTKAEKYVKENPFLRQVNLLLLVHIMHCFMPQKRKKKIVSAVV